VRVEGVGINPTRSGLFEVLREMGADLTFENRREEGGRAGADITARHSPLRAVDVPPELAPAMIDEFPIFFIAAALRKAPAGRAARGAAGQGIGPLARWRRGCGRSASRLRSKRTASPSPAAAGSRFRRRHDRPAPRPPDRDELRRRWPHAKEPVTVADMSPADTSFPDFAATLEGSPHDHRRRRARGQRQGHGRQGAGRHYALPFLDTGLLYRAVGLNLLRWGGDPDSEFSAVRACDSRRSISTILS
jgi:3-phosphoshikimate 1-carboxyvinyltransferase